MPQISNAIPMSANLSRLAAVIFAAVFLLTLSEHVSDILNFSFFHEEHRNLYHFDTTWENSNDYIAQYLGSAPVPHLYGALTHVVVGFGIDLVLFHKVLMLVCGALLLLGSAMAGYRIGGGSTAWLTVFLIAAQPAYFYQINSATPHAFAFPLLMWGLVCHLYGRPYFLAFVTVLASLLYVPVSPLLGMGLAWMLLTNAIKPGSKKREVFKAVMLLVLTATIAMINLLAQLAPSEEYGLRLEPNELTELYPENGLKGRLHISATKPIIYVFSTAYLQFQQVVPWYARLLLLILYIAIGMYGIRYLRRRGGLINAIAGFAIPCVLFFAFVHTFKPYISYRFLLYPLFTILPVCFVAGIYAIFSSKSKRSVFQVILIIVITGSYFVAFDSRNAELKGFTLQLDEPGHKLMKYLGELPEATLLAAWPLGKQTDLIPYIGKRSLFTSGKAHYTIYENHIIEMRKRTTDLLNAYLGSEPSALHQLWCRWGVGFVIVDKRHFTDKENKPEYFAPFSDVIVEMFKKTKSEDMYLYNPPKNEIVFESQYYSVIDLSKTSQNVRCAFEY